MSRPSALAILFAGAVFAEEPRGGHIDAEWFRSALLGEAAHWREAAATESGFFQPFLDRRWRPKPRQYGTLVSQCRQMFVMARGYELSGEQAYLTALRKGADFLLSNFRDQEYGGWFWSISPSGQVLDAAKDTYGHAFVLFGLAHAARVTGDTRYRDAALRTWAEMKLRLRYSSGFFKPRTTRDYSRIEWVNSQNPMMHLFEALLALYDATGSKTILLEAEEHAARIFTRLYQDRPGYLPENFDADWRPLAPAARGYIEMGHQFEWAFLLSEGVSRGLPPRFLQTGRRLLEYGMKAYDADSGGIFSRGDYDGTVQRGAKEWWQQCESLRTMMHYAALRDRADMWPTFDRSLAFVKRHFIDAEYGGWFRYYDPAEPPGKRDTSKGSDWLVGYHVTGMYWEALRLQVPPPIGPALH